MCLAVTYPEYQSCGFTSFYFIVSYEEIFVLILNVLNEQTAICISFHLRRSYCAYGAFVRSQRLDLVEVVR